jgi:hypothetical protein
VPLPDTWWPWLAVAGLGVLHGLGPANGWGFATAHATRSGDVRDARRALLPIAAGHAVSVVLVVVLVMQDVLPSPPRMQAVAGGGLLALAVWRWLRRPRDPTSHVATRSHAALAAWSCLMGSTHGSGLMLVPALMPLCLSGGPARAITATGSFALMLAAVILHLLAMLLTTYIVATGICRALQRTRRAPHAHRVASLWTLALAFTGAMLIATR